MRISKKNLAKAKKLAKGLDISVKPGPKPSMDEIIAEIKEYRASLSRKPGDFFGILTPKEGEKFEKYVQQIRNEWG